MLDTGLGAPKHPLFLFGKKYSDADKQPSYTTAARPRTGSLRSWWVGRKVARQPASAAVQPKRNPDNMQNPQQSLSLVPQLGSPCPGSSHAASSLDHSTRAEQPSFQLAVINGRSPADASANTEANLQPDAGMSDPSWAGRPHPTPVPLSMLALPAADSCAHTAADSLANLHGSAIDVEAQNGACLDSQAPNGTAEMTGAGCDLWPGNNGNASESGDAADEPTDVAAERVKADRLWATMHVNIAEGASRAGHRGGSGSRAGPAILLHNLRKVCKAANSRVESRMLQCWMVHRSTSMRSQSNILITD